MTEIAQALSELAANPQGLIVIVGLALMILGVWGRIEGKIDLDYPSRIASASLGLVLTGLGLFLQWKAGNPAPPQPKPSGPAVESPVAPSTPVAGAAPAQQHHEQLQQAYGLASQGNFQQAIQVAQGIPSASATAPRAQQKISEWRSALEIQRSTDEQKTLQRAFDAAARRDFDRAVQVARTIRPPSRFHALAAQKLHEWEEAGRQRSLLSDHEVLTDAYQLASEAQFGAAIAMATKLRSTSANPETQRLIDQKIRDWQSAEQQGRIDADRALLQEAYAYASNGQFEQAIARARTISPRSPIQATVRKKIRDWSRMLDIRNRAARQTSQRGRVHPLFSRLA